MQLRGEAVTSALCVSQTRLYAAISDLIRNVVLFWTCVHQTRFTSFLSSTHEFEKL